MGLPRLLAARGPAGASPISRQAKEKALAALQRARAQVVDLLTADLTDADGPTDFSRFVAERRKQAIEQAITRLERELLGVAEETATEATRAAAEAASAKAGIGVAVDPGVVAYAADWSANEIVGVTAALKARVRGQITNALAGGMTRAQLVAGIRDAFSGKVTQGRIERILRTEVITAFTQMDAAAHVAMKRAGVDLIKVWRHSGKAPHRARDSHEAIDGQERELDEPFNVGGGATARTPPGNVGHKAMVPLDPRLPPEEAIHCGCYVIEVPRGQAKQAYIDKAAKGRGQRR